MHAQIAQLGVHLLKKKKTMGFSSLSLSTTLLNEMGYGSQFGKWHIRSLVCYLLPFYQKIKEPVLALL